MFDIQGSVVTFLWRLHSDSRKIVRKQVWMNVPPTHCGTNIFTRKVLSAFAFLVKNFETNSLD